MVCEWVGGLLLAWGGRLRRSVLHLRLLVLAPGHFVHVRYVGTLIGVRINTLIDQLAKLKTTLLTLKYVTDEISRVVQFNLSIIKNRSEYT